MNFDLYDQKSSVLAYAYRYIEGKYKQSFGISNNKIDFISECHDWNT